MADLPAVSTNAEDYLEAILRLVSEKGAARVRDLASALSLHKSTVSSALKGLSEKGLVNYSPYEITTLTELGEEIAQDVQRRHTVLGRFLSEILGVDDATAQANACRMEHIVDPGVLDRLALLMDFAREQGVHGKPWVAAFQEFSKTKLRRRARRAGLSSAVETPKPATAAVAAVDVKRLPTLDRVTPGKKAKVMKVGGEGVVRRRMADMGMVRGAMVEVVKVAPLGDPIEVKLKGYHLSLRKEEAAAIAVELP
ncbi:MAG: DtxR family transcriptional regulator [Planctomycetaceae bacterium]|nr:DtxR family transcriptional regulator [Planctomycetaceae bacterium]